MMRGSNSGALIVLALLAASAVGISLGVFSNRLNEKPPDLRLPDNMEIKEGTWVVVQGTRYVIWDIKLKQTQQLAFMVAAHSEAEVLRDTGQMARAFATRLLVHTTEIVMSISSTEEGMTKVDQALSYVGSLGQIAGDRKFASEVRNIRSQLQGNTKLLAEISAALEVAKGPAQQLAKDHTDTSANSFLNSLIVASGISRSKTATTAVSLMLMASQAAQIPGWIDSFLTYLDANTPTLEALARTYGAAQVFVTIDNMNKLGI